MMSEHQEMSALTDYKGEGRFKSARAIGVGWEDFDRIYSIAAQALETMREDEMGASAAPTGL